MIEYIVIVIVVILLSMTLHEAMHAFMGYWLGDDTAKQQGRLTLNPLKHIDPFLTLLLPIMLALIGAPIFGGAKPVPFNPDRVRYDEWGAALVALAGPLTNLVIAFLAYGGAVLIGQPIDFTSSPHDLAGLILQTTVFVNLGFFVFNMLPLPPLDGSRVVYALAPEFVRRIMETIERFGLIFVFALILIANDKIGAVIRALIELCLAAFRAVYGLF
jgi:Zn-dependent protease